MFYANEEDCPNPQGSVDDGTVVTFRLKKARYHEIDGKFVVCRFFGKIVSADTDNHVYELEEFTEHTV